MAEKILQTRIQLKYDTYENWSTANPVLKKGEMAVATIGKSPTQAVDSVTAPQVILKVGDGTTAYKNLPFASALAADVYNWAKSSDVAIEEGTDGYNLIFKDVSNRTIKTVALPKFALKSDIVTVNNGKFTVSAGNKGLTLTGTGTMTANQSTDTKAELSHYTPTTSDSAQTIEVQSPSSGTAVVTGVKTDIFGHAVGITSTVVHDTNQKVKAGDTTFSNDAVVDFVAGDNVTITATSTDNPPNAKHEIKISSTDTNDNQTLSIGGFTFDKNATVTVVAGSNMDTISQDAVSKTISINGKSWATEIADAKKAGTDAATAVTNLENGQVKTNTTDITSLKNQIGGLSGAMHFEGKKDTIPTTGDFENGDVIIVGKKEYVYDSSNGSTAKEHWVELGDESSYALKTTTINNKALSSNITLTAADVGAATAADITTEIEKLDVAIKGGSGKYIASIKQDDGKITATEGTMPTALKNPNALTFGSKTYDGSAAKTIVASDLGALTEVTTTANGGLKVTNKNKIDIDTDVTFVFDCGSATTVI